jgi:hypothetical protein
MTVLSLQYLSIRGLAARPRRRVAALREVRRERRTYRDSFFADPAVVEDDSLRMSRRGASSR